VETARVQYYSLNRLDRPVALLLSTLAHAGHDDTAAASLAFERGAAELQRPGLRLVERRECAFPDLDAALDRLNTVSFKLKRRLLEACAAVILADRQVTAREAELLRGVADSLGCPMPPVLSDRR